MKGSKPYTVRYSDDLYSIVRTLALLLDYEKDLIYFVSNNNQLWANKQDRIVRIAFLLYLLSYKDLVKAYTNLNEKNKDRCLEEIAQYGKLLSLILENFDRQFSRWNSSEKYRYKRLWAALRDYLKLAPLSNSFLHHFNFGEDWKTLFQLEFPGDVWKLRFADRVLKPMLEEERLHGKQVFLENSASTTMRRMFEWLAVKSDYYPEQFDVSFDFASRMCRNRFCDLCPFGKGSVDICFERKSQGKSCSVALFTCGYRSQCKSKECPIPKGIGVGSCAYFEKIYKDDSNGRKDFL